MRTDSGSSPRAVVIGGGATGCGVARDLTLRGFAVTLVEFGDLGSGTSSRFHGMLQCGARYAVSDTEYAAECMRERLNVAEIAPDAIEHTGGLFVSLPEDPPDFADDFVRGCTEARIPVRELDLEQVMREEPKMSQNILRAFSVPDSTVQPWRLLNILIDDVRRRGGEILTRHQVTGIDVANGRAHSVRVEGPDGARTLEADVIVNAAGPWSARVAGLVGEGADIELGKGSILVLSHRMVTRIINRCRPPSSHDIMVPTGTVSLFGTTSEVVDSPDTTYVRPEEIQELLDNAEVLFPGIRDYRAFRAWAGVRPLFKPKGWASDKPLPRRHSIVDHADAGISGFWTICGGSLTTHRSMAEDIGDRICRSMGIDAPCLTTQTRVPESAYQSTRRSGWHPSDGYRRVEETRQYQQPVCECESVSRADVASLVDGENIDSLHDLRRRLRVGFGPCQGTFCGSRVASMILQSHPTYNCRDDLTDFWTERLKGSMRTAWGDQARQMLLSDIVYRETLGLRLMPEDLPTDPQR
ncbi:MAG: FAD-dependent oxidoreductase [Alphaproteobacteria bacterium]